MKPYIFYPDPCGRGLKPLLSAVSTSGFTSFVWPIAVSKIPGSSGSSLRFFPAVATFFFHEVHSNSPVLGAAKQPTVLEDELR